MIKINGKYIRNIPEQVGKNKRDIFQLDTDLTALEVKVNTALAGVFHYKGSVATYGDLPASDNEVGDVYNVIDTGKNYAWDGSAWDDLGGLVDLSNYVTLNTDQTIGGHKKFSDPNGITAVKYSGEDWGHLDLYGEEGVYITTGTSYRFVDIQGSLDPNVDATYDIGSSNSWRNLSLSGSLKTSSIKATDGNEAMKFSGTATSVKWFYPYATNTYDLGGSSLKWKDAYIAGSIYFGNTGSLYSVYKDGGGVFNLALAGSSLLRAYSTFFSPAVNNSMDLGSSSLAWKDFYLAGNLSNGTDSVTVADLAALIAYAKAQGWIS